MVDCISGGMGEVAAIVALFPLDTLKVHCQARSITLIAAFRHVLQQGPQSAMRSLYAGVGTAALGSAIVGAVHLSVYHYWKRLGHRLSEKKSSADGGEHEPCSTGPLAVFGAVMSSVTVGALEAPLDQIKLKRQANTIHGSPLRHLLETISSLGARHLFNSSFAPFVMKAIPHDVGEFVTFSALSENKSVQKSLLGFSENTRDVILGATAGCAAAILSTPFDVICTKVQTSAVSSQSSKNSTMLNSFRAFGETARIEFSSGGMKALYAGFVPRLLQMVPASVIYWAVVESTRRSLQQDRNGDAIKLTIT